MLTLWKLGHAAVLNAKLPGYLQESILCLTRHGTITYTVVGTPTHSALWFFTTHRSTTHNIN